MPGGPRSKLTKRRKTKIVDALKNGAYREPAARAAGIGESTLYRWLEQGEADLEHGRSSPERELWEAIQKAEGEAEDEAVKIVMDAGRAGDWKAAMTYLERKHPAKWGRRLKITDDTPRPAAPLHGQSVAEYEERFRAAFGDDLDVDTSQLMPGMFDVDGSSNGSNGSGP